MSRILSRTVTLLVIAALLGGVVYWLKGRRQDRPLVDLPAVDSKGYVLALKQTEAGDRLVAISPTGEIREATGTPETIDREPTWTPDGRRAVFVSNRSIDGSYQIFEWKPDRTNEPFQITPNGAARRNPWMTADGAEVLYASQGDVIATAYSDLRTRRIMPPSDDPNAQHEEGQPEAGPHQHDIIGESWMRTASALDGEAFAKGFISKGGKYFVGIYTTARGQAFVVQNMEPSSPNEVAAMVPVAGDRIEVSFDWSTARAIISVVNFRYPMLDAVPKDKIRKDGTVIVDFVNALFILDLPAGRFEPLFISKDGSEAAINPALSPDGSEVAVVVQEKSGDALVSKALMVLPLSGGGPDSAKRITTGDIHEPTWSPDGETLAFARGIDIWTVKTDGTNERNLTQGKGKFRSPSFSPMR
jgi:dipeptidyl aminopeptidase/acylaminoacyl peptidase